MSFYIHWFSTIKDYPFGDLFVTNLVLACIFKVTDFQLIEAHTYHEYIEHICTVQLSSKVTFARVSDAFHTRSGRAHRLAKKGRGTRVRLVAALLQGFALAWTRLTCVPDASCTRFRRVRTLPWS